jgi:hypothetical protein
MTVLQAAAALVLWRSARFDTYDIAKALGGVSPKRTSAACSMPFATASATPTSVLSGRM